MPTQYMVISFHAGMLDFAVRCGCLAIWVYVVGDIDLHSGRFLFFITGSFLVSCGHVFHRWLYGLECFKMAAHELA